MTEKNNAKCSICGKDYHVCRSCKDSINLVPYKNFVDTPNCYKVFQVVRGFNTGMYTKDEARERLQNVDLSGISFRPHIKSTIDNILKEESFKKKNKKDRIHLEVVEPVVEMVEEPIIEVVEESIEGLVIEPTEESVVE